MDITGYKKQLCGATLQTHVKSAFYNQWKSIKIYCTNASDTKSCMPHTPKRFEISSIIYFLARSNYPPREFYFMNIGKLSCIFDIISIFDSLNSTIWEYLKISLCGPFCFSFFIGNFLKLCSKLMGISVAQLAWDLWLDSHS